MTYQSVFGGNTVYPSDVSLLHVHFETILHDVQLEWPLERGGDTPLARIIEAHPDIAGRKIILPPGNTAGVGETVLFNNFNSIYSFEVDDFLGNIVATIPPGTCWQVYLAHNDTPQGQWFAFQFGASTATVQPSALAGFGLTVTGTTLSAAVPVINFSTTGITVAPSNRASAFVWQGTGAGVLNLLTASVAGNNFIFHVRNEGGGSLTVDPAGSDQINGGPTLVLHPGDSASVFTDGVSWHTIGLGQDPVFAFDYTAITVTGGTYTLTGSELDRISYKFLGTLTSDVTIVVPATIQQYWITNATTGPFRMFIKTAAGSPTQINQGAKGIYYCDGTSIILASDPLTITTPINISDGGTGATTGDAALINLGVNNAMLPLVKASTADAARGVIQAAKSADNSDITSMTSLTAITAATLALTGGMTISGTLGVAGAATFGGLTANGITTNTLVANGNTTINGSLSITCPLNTAGNVEVRNGAPFVELRDIDGPTGFIHCNGGIFYILRGDPDSGTWTQVGGQWPMQINMANNDVTLGHSLTLAAGGVIYADGAGLTGTGPNFRANWANYADNSGYAANAGHATNCSDGTIWNTNFTSGNTFSNNINVNNSAFVNVGGNIGLYDGAGGWAVRLPYNGQVVIGEAANRGVYIQGGCTVNGDVYAAGNVGGFSDRRLKTDLVRIEGALDRLQQLTGYTYQRIDLGFAQAGLIAQDVQKVMPVGVSEDKSGMLSINHGAMLGLIVEAIKELREEVCALKDLIR